MFINTRNLIYEEITMKHKFLSFLFIIAFSFTIVSNIHAHESTQTKIEFWHAFGSGKLAELVSQFVQEFNEKHPDYKVIETYKGNYEQTLAFGIAAIRTNTHPDIIMVYDAGTATMIGSKKIIYPLHQLFKDSDIDFDVDDINPAIKSYYITSDGKLLSYPFNASTPVLYYNVDLFKKAGIDINVSLKTWDDVKRVAQKLKTVTDSPITSAWTMWVHMENFAALHNVALASKNNGYDSVKNVKYLPNSTPFIKHWETLKELSDEGLYVYKGRSEKAEASFPAGEVAMMTGSSSTISSLSGQVKFKFAVAPLPINTKVASEMQNSIIGGSSLWALKGHSQKRAKGTALFLAYLASIGKQKEWAKETGYVPITMSAYEELKKENFYKQNPQREIAVKQLANKKPTKNSKGYRLGFNPQIRTSAYEEYEAMINGKITVRQAIKNIQKKANALLQRFARSVK